MKKKKTIFSESRASNQCNRSVSQTYTWLAIEFIHEK